MSCGHMGSYHWVSDCSETRCSEFGRPTRRTHKQPLLQCKAQMVAVQVSAHFEIRTQKAAMSVFLPEKARRYCARCNWDASCVIFLAAHKRLCFVSKTEEACAMSPARSRTSRTSRTSSLCSDVAVCAPVLHLLVRPEVTTSEGVGRNTHA